MTAQDLNFKIRSSQASQIMTNPKTKAAKEAGELSATTKTYCQQWNKSKLYGKVKEIHAKQMDKGILQEDIAIDFLAKHKDLFLVKNDIFFEDEFMTGTPDILQGDYLADVKCSWDCFSFPLYEEQPPASYFFQLQCYMHLTGVDKSELVFVLVDTPKHLIENEAYSYCRRTGYEFTDVIDKFEKNMTYSDVPDHLRIKTYHIEYDPEVIERIQNRVEQCRIYINELNN